MPAANAVSLMQELIRRKKLDAALQGRDENTLVPLLQFILKYIHNPNYTDLLVDVTIFLASSAHHTHGHRLTRVTPTDIYLPVFGHSPVVDDLLSQIERKVKAEIVLQKEISQTKAILDMLFARSTGASNDATTTSSTTGTTLTVPSASVSASS